MMTKKRSTRLSLLRYLLALPVIVLLLMAFTYDEAYGLDELPVFSDEFPEIPLPSFGGGKTEEVVAATILPAEEKENVSDFSEGKNETDLPFLTNELFKGKLLPITAADPADTTKPQPLIVLNGQIRKEAKMDAFPPDKIKSVNVLKGEKALEKYGEEGSNGVVEIDCPDCTFGKIEKKGKPAAVDFSDKLILLNGVRISHSQFQAINPEKIESVEVWIDEKAVEQYGEEGKNGVVEINCPNCKTEEVDKEKTSVRIRGGSSEPLYVINGVIRKKEDGDPLQEISPDQIKSVNVLKGDQAVEKYGDQGTNGVVEIECSGCEDKEAEKVEPAPKIGLRIGGKLTPQPLYILNGEKIDHVDLNEINPGKIKSITVLKDASATEKYGEAGKNGVVIIDCPKCDLEDLKGKGSDKAEAELKVVNGTLSKIEEPFTVVEEAPVFEGCDGEGMSLKEQAICSRMKLIEYVYSKIKYPADKEIEGTVLAEFVVTKSGEVRNLKILRSLAAEFDQAVLDAIEQLPRFKPGIQRGKKVNVKMTLPVKFKPQASPGTGSMAAEIAKKKELEAKFNSEKVLNLQSFSATPNPTKGRLHLRFEAAPQSTLIRIMDAAGKEVIREQLQNFNGLYDEYLDLSKAPKGMLLIHISQGDRQFVHKIVAQ